MTNTGTTHSLAEVAPFLLRSASATYDQLRDKVGAKVATGDFAHAVAWDMAAGVRLQYRVRVLTRLVDHGDVAVVALLSRELSDGQTFPDPFSRAVAEAQRSEALALLRELRPYLSPEAMVELVEHL